VPGDLLEVGVVDFCDDHREEDGERLRLEFAGRVVGELAQVAQVLQQGVEHLDRVREHQAGRAAERAPDVFRALRRRDRDLEQAADRLGVGETVAECRLAVLDLSDLGETRHHPAPRHLEQEGVFSGHRPEDSLEAEVFDQGLPGLGELRGGAEVAVAVHQVGLHRPILSVSCS